MSARIARTWRNLVVLPVVLFVRVPVLCLLLVLIKTGEGAQWLADLVSRHTPGLDEDIEHARREQQKRHARTVAGYRSNTRRPVPRPQEQPE